MRSTKFAVLLTALFALTGNAATLYVATNGSDSNSGASDAPLKTITAAASKAQPGDTVNVAAGVYNGTVRISSKGTATAPITFRGVGAIIDGTGTAAGTDLVSIASAQYVEFTGFEVRNSTRIGILAWGCQFVGIRGNDTHNNVKGGIYAGYTTAGTSHDITVDGNRVHNNVLENQVHATSGGWSQSLGIQNTSNAKVTNNKVYNNDGEGIVFVLSSRGLAQRNEVYDNFSVEIYLDNAQATTVDSNFVYSTGNSRYYRDGFPAPGLACANETYSTSLPLSDNKFTNNIVLRSRWGFYYGNFETGGGMKNTLVANNTFYGASQEIIKVDASAHTGSTIENNIFAQSGGLGANVGGSGVTYTKNTWYGATAGSASSTGDFIGDPRFTNAGGTLANDYKLTSTSPVLGLGVAVSAVTTDYFGNGRPSNVDMGAHQYSLSGSTGATPTPTPAGDTIAPSAATNVRTAGTTQSSITLVWDAASDNVGVTSYKVYRNNMLVANVATTSYTDQSLAAGTAYTYYVVAFDAAGNASTTSNVATAATVAATPTPAPAGDTTAPTAVTNLRSTGSTTSSITLTWNASTDNVGVVSYKVYRNNILVANIGGTSYTDQSLIAGTAYTYYVVAFDAAGNASMASNVTTAATTTISTPAPAPQPTPTPAPAPAPTTSKRRATAH